MKKRSIILILTAVVLVAVSVVVAVYFLRGNSERPMSAAEMLNLGEKHLIELDYEQALVHFLNVIEIEPRNSRAYLGAAEAYVALGQHENALEILELGYERTDDEGIRQMLDELNNLTDADGVFDIAVQEPTPTSSPFPLPEQTPEPSDNPTEEAGSTPLPEQTPEPTPESTPIPQASSFLIGSWDYDNFEIPSNPHLQINADGTGWVLGVARSADANSGEVISEGVFQQPVTWRIEENQLILNNGDYGDMFFVYELTTRGDGVDVLVLRGENGDETTLTRATSTGTVTAPTQAPTPSPTPQTGVSMVFEAATATPSLADINTAISIMRTRLDSRGIVGASVEQSGTNQISVTLPTGSPMDVEMIVAELGRRALLTFRDESGNVLLTGADVAEASADSGGDFGNFVSINLTEQGAAAFADATRNNIGRSIMIYMDDDLVSAPIVNSVIIDGRLMIAGEFTVAEATTLARIVQAGALPFSMYVVSID